MRPVDKGASLGSFTDYREARDPLMTRLGEYCSYCERVLSDPEVEHQEPKATPKYAHRSLDWDNFLLACTTCNRQKSDKDPRTERIYFPDEANTAYAFLYDTVSNQISPRFNKVTHPNEHRTAEHTITLMDLIADWIPWGVKIDAGQSAKMRGEWQIGLDSDTLLMAY